MKYIHVRTETPARMLFKAGALVYGRDMNKPNTEAANLSELGWRHFFLQQLDADELVNLRPVRVLAAHRNTLRVAGDGFEAVVPQFYDDTGHGQVTVGDWLLLDGQGPRPERLLDRMSVFQRRAPGEARRTQLIAANIDTLFITTSCNNDFNVARLERYLALAAEADVTPVIVLTKADQTNDPDTFRDAAAALMANLVVEVLNAKDQDQAARLLPWCGKGQTVAFVGSSGVGKSTLVNSLLQSGEIETQAVREDDARGRHTTTHREMHRLPTGGWLLDTPGMRELQLTDVEAGIDTVFADITELAHGCKFNDCQHETEPGCAVTKAVESGQIDPDRLRRWKKLVAEEAMNNKTLAQRRSGERAFSKKVRSVVRAKRS